MKMPKELKARWLKALRSGKYKQGTGALYNPEENSFCCLGVLNHVALDGHIEIYSPDDNTPSDGSPEFRAVPSETFYDRFECDFMTDDAHLIQMNDGAGGEWQHDFKSIADWIAKNIKGI